MDETSPVASRPARKRWPVWLVAVVLLSGAIYLVSQRSAARAQSTSNSGGKKGGRRGMEGPIPVGTAAVTKGNIGIYINALGTVTPVYTVAVTSRVAGQLMEVDYHEGQIVNKGQLLALIDPRPYQATLVQAQGQLSRDQAVLQNARLDLTRYQTAYAQRAIPAQTLNTQEATVSQDQGTVRVDEGSLDAAQVNLDYTRITAPISGRVGLRAVDPGNIVQATGTQTLATITQLRPITVIFPIAEDYVDEVAGQLRKRAVMRVDALNREDESVLAHGTVLTIDNEIDPTTGTVRVRATFPNTDYALFPNQFVNAKLLVRTLTGVNLIPAASIQRDNDTTFVYVVDGSDKVHTRNIDVATIDGEMAAATGVNPGETLVVDGFDRLVDGAAVHPQASASFQNGKPTGSQGQGLGKRQRQGQASDQPNPSTSPTQPGAAQR